MALTKASFSMISGAPFNVLDYGDVSSDLAPVLKLAAQAATASQGTVVIPAGTYTVKSGIDGIADSIDWLRLDMHGVTLEFDTTGGDFNFLADIDTLEINGGQLGNTGAALGSGMTIRYVTGTQTYSSLKLNGVTFQTGAGEQDRCIYAFQDVDISSVEIRGCVFRNFGRGGIELLCSTEASQEARYWIEDNYFKNFGNSSSLGCTMVKVGTNNSRVQRVSVTNNVFDRASVTGGSLCEVHAVLIYGESVIIDGNHVTDIRNDHGDDAEAIYVKASYTRIVNNYVKNGGTSHDGCITVKGTGQDGADGFSDYCVVSNNIVEFDSNGHDAPAIGIQRSYVTVTGNVLKDLRSTRTSKSYSIAFGIGTSEPVSSIIVSNNVVNGFVNFIGNSANNAYLTDNITIEGNVVTDLSGGYGIFYRNDARVNNRTMIFNATDKSISMDQTVAYPGTWIYPIYRVGDQVRIDGTASNDGTYTIVSYVDNTRIVVAEPLVNETIACEAYRVNTESIKISGNNIRSNAGLFAIRNNTNACLTDVISVADNVFSGFNYVYRLDSSGSVNVCHLSNNDYRNIVTQVKYNITCTTLIDADRSPGLSSNATTLGSVIKRVPIYDSTTNALVGYMPIYDTIT